MSGEDFLCKDIGDEVFSCYLEYLNDTRDLSAITVNTHIRGVKTIINFFIERQYLEPFKMRLIRCEKPIKETYSDAEFEKLLKKPEMNTCSFAEFRNWTMVCYMLATGNRLKTVRNLKISDIDLDSMEIKLHIVKTKNHTSYQCRVH